ncbi:MAG: insulinase family protein [Porticoccaceae bacterium]|nr:insulinase family protein [Porticoccaceae bacterium]
MAIAVLLQGCSSAVSPDMAVTAATTGQVIKSANDQRQYRHIQLDNQLDVLLISDPSTDKAAASLDVYIGSYQNEADREGLAHFLEHMLFLGTKSYPNPGDYQTFISEHGGSHNAGTGLENTTYFFDIDASYLEQALDRFAPFFSSPNFDAKYVDRERNAVESEYRLKIKDDGRRQWDVLQEQLDPDHPMAKFTVGNLQTLANRKGAEGRPVREDLIDFYNQYYSANLMKLVVLGKENLDQLEAMIKPRFAPINNNNTQIATHTDRFIQAERLPLTISMAPLKDVRELSLSFQLPKMVPHWQQKPASYIAGLVGHEGEGSLLQLLKNKGWAEGLSAGSGLEDRSSSLFSIDIALTPLGLEYQDDIIEMVFAWIDLIREQGIQNWRYKERSRMADIAFKFQEKQNPMGYVSGLAGQMQHYPVTEVLRAGYLMTDYDAELIRQVADQLTTDNLFVMLTAPEVATDRVSLRYQADYAVNPVNPELLARWQQPSVIAELRLPERNPYIPSSLELQADTGSEVPQQLIAQEGLSAWHLADTDFGVPKAHIITLLKTGKASTIEGLTATHLYLDLVKDQLGAQIYPATEAGLSFSLEANGRGISIVVGGYSDKQSVLLDNILRALANPEWNQDRFDRLKQTRLRQLSNFQREYPFRQVMSGLYAMIAGAWTPLQQVPVLEQISMTDLQQFTAGLLQQISVEMLVSGNHGQAEATALIEQVAQSLTLKDIAAPIRIARLGQAAVDAHIPVDHADSVVTLYLQGAGDSLEERAKVLLLGEMLSSPFYNSLRTEKQLGYVVSAFASNHSRVPGLAMLVQSPVADEAELRREFNQFITDYRADVSTLSDQDIKRYQASVLSSLEEKPKNLAEMNGRFMESIGLGYRQFDFRAQLASAVRAVTVSSLQDAFQRLLLDRRRSLWIQTVDSSAENTGLDLRESGQAYEYDF